MTGLVSGFVTLFRKHEGRYERVLCPSSIQTALVNRTQEAVHLPVAI